MLQNFIMARSTQEVAEGLLKLKGWLVCLRLFITNLQKKILFLRKLNIKLFFIVICFLLFFFIDKHVILPLPFSA